MLTNTEFKKKLERKREDKLVPDSNKYISKVEIEKGMIIRQQEKQKTKVIVPVNRKTSFYRSQYVNYCTGGLVSIRCRNMRVYYCVQEIDLDEFREQELNQMLEHYYAILKETRKAFMMFLRAYVIVDELLLDELIVKVSSTASQRNKKREQWKRYKQMHPGIDARLFNDLKKLTPKQKQQIKGMEEYNRKFVRNIQKS